MGNKDKSKSQEEKFNVLDYLIINLVFWGFCGILFGIIRLITGESTGLGFLFLVLSCGFTIMSIFDGLFDYFYNQYRKAGH